MRAIVFENIDELPQIQEIQIEPQTGQAEVSLLAAAFNHRDVWITRGLYPGLVPGTIMGADGVGIYDNKRVVINPGIAWGNNEKYQSPDFRVLGVPDNGTFAEKIYIEPSYLFEVPAHLSDAEAAALPVAGVTAYRALFVRAGLMEGETVVITGIGGGVALIAALMAKASGARVFFTSGSDEKIEKAMSMGLDGGVNYKNENWAAALYDMSGPMDVVIDSAAGDGISALMKYCSYGSRIVLYGGARGKINGVNPQTLFWKQMSIMGSSMGSPKDFADMLHFVDTHKIKPPVHEILPFDAYAKAFSSLANSEQMGKIVLSIGVS